VLPDFCEINSPDAKNAKNAKMYILIEKIECSSYMATPSQVPDMGGSLTLNIDGKKFCALKMVLMIFRILM
jgi:hypothetical protein